MNYKDGVLTTSRLGDEFDVEKPVKNSIMLFIHNEHHRF